MTPTPNLQKIAGGTLIPLVQGQYFSNFHAAHAQTARVWQKLQPPMSRNLKYARQYARHWDENSCPPMEFFNSGHTVTEQPDWVNGILMFEIPTQGYSISDKAVTVL